MLDELRKIRKSNDTDFRGGALGGNELQYGCLQRLQPRRLDVGRTHAPRYIQRQDDDPMLRGTLTVITGRQTATIKLTRHKRKNPNGR